MHEVWPASKDKETDIISPYFQDSVLGTVSLYSAACGKAEDVTTSGEFRQRGLQSRKTLALGLAREMSGYAPGR